MLRGLGTAMALPWFESMALATGSNIWGGKPPVRMAFLFAPNGKHMPDWTPHLVVNCQLQPGENSATELVVAKAASADGFGSQNPGVLGERRPSGMHRPMSTTPPAGSSV